MFISTGFTFDGVHSSTKEVEQVRFSGGFFEQRLSPSRQVLEEVVSSRSKPFFYGVEETPLEFTVNISKRGEWTEEERREFIYWIVTDEYKLLEIDDMNINFKVISVQQPIFHNNGTNQGYYEVSFRADASHGYAPKTIINKNFLGVLDTDSSRSFVIQNMSNCKERYYPHIKIKVAETETSFKIENLSNGYSLEFIDLSNTEEENIYIDGENDIIVSSLGENRLKDLVNLEFLHLSYGSNNIRVSGDIDVEFIVEYPIAM